MQIQDNINFDTLNFEVTTELQDLFTYSNLPIIIFLIAIIIVIVLLLIPKRKVVTEQPVINISSKGNVKDRYLKEIDKLLKDINEGKITSRKAYQTLSKLIRNFIYEMTGIEVQNCTLKDISKKKMPILYELVSEYYDPEFAKISKGNIISSIEKTRDVITRWN